MDMNDQTADFPRFNLESLVIRSITFGGFDAEIVPVEQLQIAAAQTFVARAVSDPTPLTGGCLLCHGEHKPVSNAYAAFVGVRGSDDSLTLVTSFTLLCNDHVADQIKPSIPFRNSAYELSVYEMQTLQDFVVSELVMPDAIWIVEIGFGVGLTSDDLVKLIIDASHL